MTTVYLEGSPLKLEPKRIMGQGGEAVIYDIGSDTVLKLFKQPNHPDFAGRQDIQKAVRERLDEYQAKLPAFPSNLPPQVVTPLACATDARGKTIVGYTMRKIAHATELIRYADKAFRRNIPLDDVRNIMLDLHRIVSAIHTQHVVIGDFNDLNILIDGTHCTIIDTDSFQFGNFFCRMFTERFVDPMLCSYSNAVMLASPHRETSDWYAYAAILMQLLLFVGPYGGIHKPKNAAHRYHNRERMQRRITVFNPDVAYPKPALHYSLLPDDLLHEFSQIFERDKRGSFPRQLVENIRWKQCASCGIFHARPDCPSCIVAPHQIVKEQIRILGSVKATRIFRTHGTILHATSRNGTIQWLYEEGGSLKREQGTTIRQQVSLPHERYCIIGNDTVIAARGYLTRYSPSKAPLMIPADTAEGHTQFATDGEALYWLEQGRLLKEAAYGPTSIGSALAGHTQFWMGPQFGFGFYRAGALSNAFIAKPTNTILNDTVLLPQIRGRILQAHCTFSRELCWCAITTDEHGILMHRVYLINAKGVILAQDECNAADMSWISSIGGACAVGTFLFVPTDKGIVRVEQSGSRLTVTREYPDTEPFVDSACALLPCQGGIAVQAAKDITILSL